MAMTEYKFVSKDNLLYFWLKIKLLLTNKVDKVEGKGLSTNDLTDELKQKILNAGDSTFTGIYSDLTGKPSINNVELGTSNSLSDLGIQPAGDYLTITDLDGYVEDADIADFITETEVDSKIANLVNSAPQALDTLNELATALGNDPNFATTVTNELADKVDADDLMELTNAEIDQIIASSESSNSNSGESGNG